MAEYRKILKSLKFSGPTKFAELHKLNQIPLRSISLAVHHSAVIIIQLVHYVKISIPDPYDD